jgi:hypothetical protein
MGTISLCRLTASEVLFVQRSVGFFADNPAWNAVQLEVPLIAHHEHARRFPSTLDFPFALHHYFEIGRSKEDGVFTSITFS